MRVGLRLGAVVVALSGLTACSGSDLPSLPQAEGGAGSVVQRIALRDGAVTAAGPNGYCADPRASRPARGFAIFATCAALGDDSQPFARPAVVTVQVGPMDSASVTGQEAAMIAFFESAQGAQTLSRINDASTVKVQSTKEGEGVVSVRFTDDAPSDIDGQQDLEWRAFLDIGGRLVTLSVRGLQEAPMERSVGSALLRQAIAAIRAANAAEAATEDG